MGFKVISGGIKLGGSSTLEPEEPKFKVISGGMTTPGLTTAIKPEPRPTAPKFKVISTPQPNTTFNGKVIPEIRALKPKEVLTPLSPEQKGILQQRRDVALVKQFPNDLYSGVSAPMEAFAQGILPIRPKELQRPGVEEAYPIPKTAGLFTGLAASQLATAPLQGIIRATPLIQKLGTLGTLGKFGARVVSKAGQFGAAGGLKEFADQSIKLANKETSIGQASKDIAKRMVQMATFAGPAALANPIARITAEAGYGFGSAKMAGASNIEASVQGLLQLGLGLIDRSNYAVTERQAAYRDYLQRFNRSLLEKQSLSHEQSLGQAQEVVSKFGKSENLKVEIRRLSTEGRIIPIGEGEVGQIANRIQGMWARQIRNAKVSRTSAALMTPEEILGARDPGTFVNPLKPGLQSPVFQGKPVVAPTVIPGGASALVVPQPAPAISQPATAPIIPTLQLPVFTGQAPQPVIKPEPTILPVQPTGEGDVNVRFIANDFNSAQSEVLNYNTEAEFIEAKGKSIVVDGKLFINDQALKSYLKRIWKEAHPTGEGKVGGLELSKLINNPSQLSMDERLNLPQSQVNKAEQEGNALLKHIKEGGADKAEFFFRSTHTGDLADRSDAGIFFANDFGISKNYAGNLFKTEPSKMQIAKLDIKKPYYATKDEIEYHAGKRQEWVKKLKSEGYDAIVEKASDNPNDMGYDVIPTEVAVFDKSQVKEIGMVENPEGRNLSNEELFKRIESKLSTPTGEGKVEPATFSDAESYGASLVDSKGNFIDLIEDFLPSKVDGEHLYHTTKISNLDKITKSGINSIKTGLKDGTQVTASFWSDDPSIRTGWGEEKDIILRTKSNNNFRPTHQTGEKGEYITSNPLSSKDIEYLGQDGKWHPLSSELSQPTGEGKVEQPFAGGMLHETPPQVAKWMEKGVTITERQAPIRIIDPEAKIKDINGVVVDLPKGHEMTPYKLSNGKIWLHDGKNVVVDGEELQRLQNKNLVLGEDKKILTFGGKIKLPSSFSPTQDEDTLMGKLERMMGEEIKLSAYEQQKENKGGFLEDTANNDYLATQESLDRRTDEIIEEIKPTYESWIKAHESGEGWVEEITDTSGEQGIYSNPSEAFKDGIIGKFEMGNWSIDVSDEILKELNKTKNKKIINQYYGERVYLGENEFLKDFLDSQKWDNPVGEIILDVLSKKGYEQWRKNWGSELEDAENAIRAAFKELENAKTPKEKVAAISIALNAEHVYGKMFEKLDLTKEDLQRLTDMGKGLSGLTSFQPMAGGLANKLDILKDKDYTLSEKEKAYGSVEKAEKAIEEAGNDISNVYSALRIQQTKKSAIAQELKDRGFVDFRGKQVSNIHEVAEIVAAFRHPKIEQFQIVFVKNNRIVAHQVITSGVPNYAVISHKLKYHLTDVAKKIGADRVYFAHNHPSGNTEVSRDDINFTTAIAKHFKGNFGGHIVTDDTEYSVIGANELTAVKKYSFIKDLPRFTGEIIKLEEFGLDGVAKIAKEFVKDNKSTIMFFDPKSTVLAIDNIDFQKNIAQYIKDSLKNYGAALYAVIFKKGFNPKVISYPAGLVDLIEFDENNAFRSISQGARNEWPKIEKENYADDYLQIQEPGAAFNRRKELMQKRLEEVSLAKEELQSLNIVRNKFRGRIQKYKGGYLAEELGGMPRFYITNSGGSKPDEIIGEINSSNLGVQLQNEDELKYWLIGLEDRRKVLIDRIEGNRPKLEAHKESTLLAKEEKIRQQERVFAGKEMGKLSQEQANITARLEKRAFRSGKETASEQRKINYFGEQISKQERSKLYLMAKEKGLYYTDFTGGKHDKLVGLLRYYRGASFDQLREYITNLTGDPDNPPKLLKLYGDINKDTEVIKLIKEASKNWVDINKVELHTLDPVRIVEKVTQQDLWNDNLLADNTFLVYAAADEAMYDRLVIELNSLDANRQGVSKNSKESVEIMRKFEAKETLTEKERKVVSYLRSKYDSLITETNAMRGRLGKRLIPYRQDYMTHIREQNLLSNFFKGDFDQMKNISPGQLDAIRKGDYTKGNMPFNKFAQQRTGKKTKYDAIGNYEIYLRTILKEIYYTPAITHARKFIEYSLVRQPNAWKALDRLANDLKGKTSIQDQNAIGMIASHPIVKKIRSLQAKSALLANINFWVMNSSNFVISYDELGNYMNKGLAKFLGTKQWRQFAFKHSNLMKGRTIDPDIDPGTFKTIEEVAGYVTNLLEYNNVGSTFIGAYFKGIDLGYNQAKAIKYADSIARRTQVGYKKYELNAWMRSNTGMLLSQFQTWTFAMMNHLIYDLKLGNIPGNIIGKFTGKTKKPVRWGAFFTLVAISMLLNMLYKKAGLRQPYEVESAIPRIPGLGRSVPPLVRTAQNIGTIFTGKKPETKQNAAIRAVTNFIPMGGQAGRFFQGRVFPQNPNEPKTTQTKFPSKFKSKFPSKFKSKF